LLRVLGDAEKQLPTFQAAEAGVIPENELEQFGLLLTNTKGWFESALRQLSALSDNQDAPFTNDDIKAKVKYKGIWDITFIILFFVF
jgi:hypothetical protein